MTAITGIRGVDIVVFVAGKTFICNRNVCAGNHIIIVVNGESGRFPVRKRGMACLTICGNRQQNMIRVQRFIVIRGMATVAVGRSPIVAVYMTFDAFGRGMCTRQWKVGAAVVKSAFPGTGWMTVIASLTVINISAHLFVFIIHSGPVAMLMAIDAGELLIICRIVVAVGTGTPFPVVLSGVYWERF